MNTLEATFRIITPMFLGGANQHADSVRPASIKGALRFWWRALNWSRCLEEKNNNEVEALKQLHAQEARLFGIAAGDNEGGQGVFLLQVRKQETKIVKQAFDSLMSGQLYLLGQGLTKYHKETKVSLCTRDAIKEDGKFTVKLNFRPKTSEVDVTQVSNALLLFGLLGALGSRARHGLGSVAITQWTGPQKISQTKSEYSVLLNSLLKNTNSVAEPPFTAFSQLSRIDISKAHKDVFNLLNSIGMEQQMYRSYGQNGKVNGKPSERKFSTDHDLIMDATNGVRIQQAPKRVVFGLPHNYFFSSTSAKADVNYAPDGKDGRRASPLLLHLHPVDDQFIAVHTLLPAKFLPAAAQIRVKTRSTVYVNPTPDWQILHTYLNRFKGELIHGCQ